MQLTYKSNLRSLAVAFEFSRGTKLDLNLAAVKSLRSI